MTQTLMVIADTSGSMCELGKPFLIRNLLRFITQLSVVNPSKYEGVSFLFYIWSDALQKIEGSSAFDINPVGSCSAKALINGINQMPKEPCLKVLLLSDGFFDCNEYTHWHLPEIKTRGIAIGMDANIKGLEWFSSNGKPYHAEDINAVVDTLLFGNII